MCYDFNEVIDRCNTNSIKHDFIKAKGKPEGVIPMWIADMDFKVPPEVTKAILKSAEHGVYGYSEPADGYYGALTAWFKNGFDLELENDWIVKTPGIVVAIAMAVRAFTHKGDAVMIQSPVYSPFSGMVLKNERMLVNNPLLYEHGRYSIDFEDFERKIVENDVKMFILCSPHNPVGRVWTVDELRLLGEICLKHNCYVVSDEIHCDFAYDGFKHTIFTKASENFWDNSIICTAPSKTFNLAGLQASNVFIANAELRQRYITEVSKMGYCQLNTVGLVACQAAYEHGYEWLKQLRQYLAKNFELIQTFLSAELPQVKLVKPEGTYLAWLDFRELGLVQNDLNDLILNKSRLWLESGTSFGAEGEGFQRMNIACPKSVVEESMHRLKSAIKGM